MANNKRGDEGLERLLNYLADSILYESDESTLAEAYLTDAEPQSSAEYTRSKLGDVSDALRGVNRRLSSLGHTIDSNWQYSNGEYQGTCVNCGSTLSFRTGSHQSQGTALKTRCTARYESVTSRREASRK